MNKEQLRYMREILKNAAYGAAFPDMPKSVRDDLLANGWIEKSGSTYKSTRLGRETVLDVSQKR